MRILISFLLLMTSFVFAQECSVSSCESSTGLSCVKENDSIFSISKVLDYEKMSVGLEDASVSSEDSSQVCFNYTVYEEYWHSSSQTMKQKPMRVGTCKYKNSGEFVYKNDKNLFCSIDVDPKPPKSAQELLNAWNKCESGKASPLFVGSPDQLKWLNGRPVKKLMCDHPPIDAVIYFDSWDDYAKDRNPKIPDFNDKSPDEPEKPTDPVDPTDPKDPKPGEGGDGENPGTGGDNGSGNGNDNGGCIGNNCGNGNDNENGKGLTKSDVTQAIKDADILGCNGNNCKAGDFSALGGDSGFADIPKSFWESKYESHDLMKLYEEKIESTGDSIVAQLRNINTDLGEGTCPVVELPEEFGSFQFDCDFLLLIKSAFLFSATLTALFIVFRR